MIGLALGGVAVVAVGVVVLIIWSDLTEDRGEIYRPIENTTAPLDPHPPQQHRTVELPVIVGWTHIAPPRPFTVRQAHVVMQQHIECAPDTCARKREAVRALEEAGILVPDSRRRRKPHPQPRKEVTNVRTRSRSQGSGTGRGLRQGVTPSSVTHN